MVSIGNVRVKVNKKYQSVYRELTSETAKHHKVFDQHAALFTLCVILGYRGSEPSQYKSHSFKGTDLFWSNTLDKYQETVVKAVAVSAVGSYEMIGKPDEIISTVELFADLGMDILIKNVLKDYLVDASKNGEYSLDFSNAHQLEKAISMFVQNEINKGPLK